MGQRNVVKRRREAAGEVGVPHSTADAGEPASRGPGRGKGAPGQPTAEGKHPGDSEPQRVSTQRRRVAAPAVAGQETRWATGAGEWLAGRAGCGKAARPDLWEARRLCRRADPAT